MSRKKAVGGPLYRVPFRRRREGKTDYRKRLKLLMSHKPRVVVRRSNKYIRIQLIVADREGDRTFVDMTSKELSGYGYEGGGKNLTAAYLTGLLFGKKAIEAGFKEAILDIGLHTPVHGSRVFAALKGVIDSGMEVPHDPVVFPPEERIRGEHIASYTGDTSIPDIFDMVKERILTNGGNKA